MSDLPVGFPILPEASDPTFRDALQRNTDDLRRGAGEALDPAPSSTVTALPGSPINGQEIFYEADATNGVIWHLKYRAASGSSYKWEFVGGPPLCRYAAAPTAPTVLGDLTGGPTFTVPFAGDYVVSFSGAGASAVAGNYYQLRGAIGSQVTDLQFAVSYINSYSATLAMADYRLNGVAASDSFRIQGLRSAVCTLTFVSMAICPVRVG